ncbi:MAG: head-tail connector protein [Bacillota bacterium]|nr:head-tail connector protein [Bacillota bacterium]
MVITTLEQVKAVLQIENEDSDVAIQTLIPAVESYIIAECKRNFEDGFPEALKLAAIKIIGHTLDNSGIKSSAFKLDIPPDALKMIKPYRRVKFI